MKETTNRFLVVDADDDEERLCCLFFSSFAAAAAIQIQWNSYDVVSITLFVIQPAKNNYFCAHTSILLSFFSSSSLHSITAIRLLYFLLFLWCVFSALFVHFSFSFTHYLSLSTFYTHWRAFGTCSRFAYSILFCWIQFQFTFPNLIIFSHFFHLPKQIKQIGKN